MVVARAREPGDGPMSTMSHPLEEGVFVCLECGFTSTTKPGLESHWLDEAHGPVSIQADALDRARVSIGAVPLHPYPGHIAGPYCTPDCDLMPVPDDDMA